MITAHVPGHVDRDRELIVGLQTDIEVTATGQLVRDRAPPPSFRLTG
ncbi:hypothetical protein ACFOY4_35230 [Actinomadura syzygii]|nr:hypothetical protein [Actinomadura syzygii]